MCQILSAKFWWIPEPGDFFVAWLCEDYVAAKLEAEEREEIAKKAIGDAAAKARISIFR